jgi:glycosyltransferase involved in cell wall biosynthesis
MNTSSFNHLVSAIVITHNRLERLERAINSVLAQSYGNIELIIVNDGSKDGTKEYLDVLVTTMPNIKVIHHDVAMGACAARNSGIKQAAGLYIAGLDDDDEWLPGRIEKMKMLYSNEFSFVYASDNIIMDDKTVPLIRRGSTNLDLILSKNTIGNQIFIEAYKLRAIDGFDVTMPAAQDWDVWIRLILKYGKACACDTVLQNVYQEGDDRITMSSKKAAGYWKLYKKHRALMDSQHRAAQLTQLYIAKNKKMSLKVAILMLKHSEGLKSVVNAMFSKQFLFLKLLAGR